MENVLTDAHAHVPVTQRMMKTNVKDSARRILVLNNARKLTALKPLKIKKDVKMKNARKIVKILAVQNVSILTVKTSQPVVQLSAEIHAIHCAKNQIVSTKVPAVKLYVKILVIQSARTLIVQIKDHVVPMYVLILAVPNAKLLLALLVSHAAQMCALIHVQKSVKHQLVLSKKPAVITFAKTLEILSDLTRLVTKRKTAVLLHALIHVANYVNSLNVLKRMNAAL